MFGKSWEMIKRGMAVALSVSLLAGAMSVSSSLPTAAASTKRVEVGTKGNVTINLDGREVWQAAADAMQKAQPVTGDIADRIMAQTGSNGNPVVLEDDIYKMELPAKALKGLPTGLGMEMYISAGAEDVAEDYTAAEEGEAAAVVAEVASASDLEATGVAEKPVRDFFASSMFSLIKENDEAAPAGGAAAAGGEGYDLNGSEHIYFVLSNATDQDVNYTVKLGDLEILKTKVLKSHGDTTGVIGASVSDLIGVPASTSNMVRATESDMATASNLMEEAELTDDVVAKVVRTTLKNFFIIYRSEETALGTKAMVVTTADMKFKSKDGGVFTTRGDKMVLAVRDIDKNSEEYKQAAATLQNNNVDHADFAAVDISFRKGGADEDYEPCQGQIVNVRIETKAIENFDPESMSIQHHLDDGSLETVAGTTKKTVVEISDDAAEAANNTVAVTEDQQTEITVEKKEDENVYTFDEEANKAAMEAQLSTAGKSEFKMEVGDGETALTNDVKESGAPKKASAAQTEVKKNSVTKTISSAVDANGVKTEVQEEQGNGDIKVEDGKVVADFVVDSFSIYTIVGQNINTIEFLSADGNMYEVTVDLRGVTNIPEGAELVVEEVAQSEYDNYLNKVAKALKTDADAFTYAKLLDISIVYNGQEIQPNGTVGVEIQLIDGEDISNPQVVHFGQKTEVLDAAKTGKGVAFETSGFSIYAVVEEAPTDYRRVKIEFYNYDETHIADMIVKNNDAEADIKTILYDPGTGTLPEKTIFKGWWQGDSANYTAADADIKKAKTIDDIRTWVLNDYDFPDYTGDDNMPVVKFYAMVYKYFNVTYYGDDEGISLGTHTEYLLTNENETNYTVSMAYTPDANQNFKGWIPTDETKPNITEATSTADNIYPNGTNITITGDVVFNVEAPHGNWLVYNANGKGATYNAPQFYLTNEKTSPAINATEENMRRNGYDFGGWYTATSGEEDETGYTPVDETKPFTFGGTLEENTNIYAKWTPVETAPYTVVLWGQNVDRSAYEVLGSYVGNGPVGQNIPYTVVENGDEDYVTGVGNGNGHYTGFSIVDSDKTQQVKITPEGDAVLYLHYDRIDYNFKFYLYRDGTRNNQYDYPNNSGTGSNLDGLVTWHSNQTAHPSVTGYTIDSETVSGRTYYYFTMQAYYGEDISSKWPTYDKITGANGREAVSYVMMVGTKLKPNPTNQGSGTVKGIITVMNENILGATNDANGNYVMIRFPDNYYNWRYHIWFETVEGEDYTGKTTHTYNGRTYYEETVLTVRSSNTTDANQNEPKYTGFDYVTRLGQNNQGVWGGGHWTTGNNPTLYHLNYIYNRQSNTIQYFDGSYIDGNGNLIQNRATHLLHTSGSILQGAKIPESDRNYIPDLPEGENGYVFEGWYLDEACSETYPWNTMPVDGIKVYAKWRQIEYRVFLHPNAGTDPTLDWGSEDQEMNFRRPYGGKVSTPTGRRTGYEFVGWFTDEGLTKVFTDSTELNDQTVTAAYDKTVDMTDPMDKWGNGATWNSDTQDKDGNPRDRFWITKKLDLYAKWRKILVGADGINVVYTGKDPDVQTEGTGIPTDELKYLDTAPAVAKQALTAPEGYVFDYWVVQRWNGSAFVDTDVIAYPGDSFEVLLDNAQQVQNEDHTEEHPSYTYTIQVRPKFALAEHETPTFIPWYANNETANTAGDDFVVFEDNVEINAMQPIKPADTFTYTGYRFVGWARVPIEIVDAAQKKTTLDDALDSTTVDYSDDLFLEYRDDGNFYSTENTVGHGVGSAGVKVNGVAPDESSPYHAMVAVWEKIIELSIVKKLDGGTEFIELPDTYNIELTFTGSGLDRVVLPEGKELDANGKVTITVEADTPVSIFAPEGISVSVKEASASKEPFESTKYEKKIGEAAAVEIAEDAAQTLTDDTEITVTNTAKKIPITGLDIDTAAARTALLSLFAFAMMCVLGFSLKRRYVSRR
jgi:uncharacterized repeat protein (TIGR02543 family)